MSKANRTYLEQVLEEFSCSQQTGPQKPQVQMREEQQTFEDIDPTAVMGDNVFRGLQIHELREVLRKEIPLLDAYAAERNCKEDVRKGLFELHAAWVCYDKGIVPYTPAELLDEKMAGKDIEAKIQEVEAARCSLRRLIHRMAADSQYRKNIRHIYYKKMPEAGLLQRFQECPKPAE